MRLTSAPVTKHQQKNTQRQGRVRGYIRGRDEGTRFAPAPVRWYIRQRSLVVTKGGGGGGNSGG